MRNIMYVDWGDEVCEHCCHLVDMLFGGDPTKYGMKKNVLISEAREKFQCLRDENDPCLQKIRRLNMYIGVDFDGTIVEHKFPEIGEQVPHAIAVLNKLQKRGYHLILWTMRSGERLEEAVQFMKDRGIKLFGVNQNPNQDWSDSPKAYCHCYIDDAALGCPLVIPADGSRAYADWHKIETMLREQGYLDPND